MKYNLEINGDAMALSVEQIENGRMTISTTDHAYTVACRRIDRHHLFLTVDGVNLEMSGVDDIMKTAVGATKGAEKTVQTVSSAVTAPVAP